MEGNGLKSSALFSFVHYFMERPDVTLHNPGSSSPSSAAVAPSVISTPIPVPAVPASTIDTPQPNSSPVASPELVKNDVLSDGQDDGNSARFLQSETKKLIESRNYLKSEEYRQLFHLPPEETLVEDFNCALQKKILLQGHMYLFERYVCFYSNIFGYEKKKVIPLKDVTCVRKAKTAGVFPNAIEITAWGKKHFFASFLSRDEAHRLIVYGWSNHSGYAKLFLGSQYSPLSSPTSQGRGSLDSSAMMSSSWRSPHRSHSLPPEATFTHRDMEDVPNLVRPCILEEDGERATEEQFGERPEPDGSVEGLSEERVSHTGSSGAPSSSIWESEDLDAPQLLDSYKTVVESEFGVDVEEFFQLFFSDEAVSFAKNFHTKCGDDEFRCTQWAKHRHFGHARDISFRHPINFYFGPKSTYCHESQRFRVYRNCHLVLETSQQMTDIPYGDYFRVEVRWDVERLFGRGRQHCFVRVALAVSFAKKTMWKGKIEQGTYDESKEAYTVWVQEAQTLIRNLQALRDNKSSNEILASAHSLSTDDPDTLHATKQGIGNEGDKESRRVQDLDHTALNESVGLSELRVAGQSNWAKRGSAVFGNVLMASQRIWDRGSNLDFKASKQLKLMLFMLVAIIIVLMQVGIMIVLARSPNVQYVSVGYPNTPLGNTGTCFGGSGGEEALAWLEQRARHVKEEISIADARLQNLNQDLASLKLHASQLHLQGLVDMQPFPSQTS